LPMSVVSPSLKMGTIVDSLSLGCTIPVSRDLFMMCVSGIVISGRMLLRTLLEISSGPLLALGLSCLPILIRSFWVIWVNLKIEFDLLLSAYSLWDLSEVPMFFASLDPIWLK